jgi:hypothetical protein
MRSGRHMYALLAAASALLSRPGFGQSAEVIPRGPNDYPSPPTPQRERKRTRHEKAERERRAFIKAAGVSGSGLWRKCRAAGRVRGH